MDEVVPGEVSLCLAKRAGGPCAVELPAMAKPPPPLAPDAWAAHFLDRAEIVWPHGKSARPLLLLRTSSLPSGNGDQAVFTQLFAYRRAADRFQQVYGKMTGRNRNEEVRYVEAGPLAGAVIAAEPTSDAPYGYWIEVSRLTASYMYRPVLRYRSATHYGDGNSLAVIDSEMPAILQRLGLSRMGSPLPLPKGRCLHPSLVKHELWCEPRPAMAGG